ncbi:hypothetical protein ACTVZO_43565 [Streptomyces sp. IBSNAI002]|uniref:hypothetical protein n=1 Tax=Streptomyces sp. IBSNAI002 TaxID=3457500 RepID=UPI003FCFB749
MTAPSAAGSRPSRRPGRAPVRAPGRAAVRPRDVRDSAARSPRLRAAARAAWKAIRAMSVPKTAGRDEVPETAGVLGLVVMVGAS